MPLVSAGLIRLLNLHEPAIQVAAEIHSDDQFIETLNLVKPDIVAVDLAMVRDDFLEQLIALRQEQPNLPIIAITTNPTADELYASSRAGVRGFLRADAEPSTIVRTIVAAVQGNSLLEGSVLESLTDYLSADMLIDQPTQRELEVLRVIGEGQSNQEIASRLHISIKTVEKHVSSLLKKSGTKNRTMLANMYMQKLSRF
jgi:DNA-binding NarL/FixJ family response regulator